MLHEIDVRILIGGAIIFQGFYLMFPEGRAWGIALLILGAAVLFLPSPQHLPVLSAGKPHLYSIIVLALFCLAVPPSLAYRRFCAHRRNARDLLVKMEAFQLDVDQHRPAGREERKLWIETEFRKRFREDIRKIFPCMYAHPRSSFETELAADDMVTQLSRSFVKRDLFINAHLKADAHGAFSLNNWFKQQFWKLSEMKSATTIASASPDSDVSADAPELTVPQEATAPPAPHPSEFVIRDRIGVGFVYENNQVHLLIVNQEPQAEYFGVFNISGGIVHGDRTSELFCRWVHTDAIRTKIARGQTCRILLARMETEPRMLTFHWVVETTTEKGAQPIPATHSSCGSTEPLVYAPDIVLTGSIFRDPDIYGPQHFRVVLHGFGAALE